MTRVDERMSLIGRCGCGAIQAAASDTPERAERNDALVAAWESEGLTTERMRSEDVCAASWTCKCRRRQAKKGQP